jgi:hypothetical protein
MFMKIAATSPSRASSRWFALVLCGLVGVFACSEGDAPAIEESDNRTAESKATSLGRSEIDLIEELSAIGYVAGSEIAGDAEGVTKHDRLRVAPGLNLITSGHGPVALLMSMDGKILHEWRAEFSQVFPEHPRFERDQVPRRNFWRDAVLFPNGDLLVVWDLFGLFKLDRDSRVLWAVPEPAHHDLQITESGEIVHLQAERKAIRGIPEQPAIEDYLVVRDARGRELRRVAMSDALRNADWLSLRKSFWARSRERGYGLGEKSVYDPFHTNSLWLLRDFEAARLGDPFRAGDALVSMAMLDTIALIDMQRGVVRWWQQGPFGMQHEPRPTLDGNIILFNNFVTDERSSAMTLDPRTGRVIREFMGPTAKPLHSKRSGRIQILPNGNTLVVETDHGRAFELTEKGSVAWAFHSPYRVGTSADRVAGLYSLERVGTKQTSWLDAKK